MHLPDRLMALKTYVLRHCVVLAAPLPLCPLIFSVSDGTARAKVLHDSGVSSEQCWQEYLRRRMGMRKLAGKRLRLDWAADAQTCAFSEFLLLAEKTK